MPLPWMIPYQLKIMPHNYKYFLKMIKSTIVLFKNQRTKLITTISDERKEFVFVCRASAKVITGQKLLMRRNKKAPQKK